MSKSAIALVSCVVGAALLTAGCTSGLRNRISVLEQNNADLAQRLNRAHSEFGGLNNERDDLDQQLRAALLDRDDCRQQLTMQPEPEPVAAGWQAVPGGAMIAIEGSVLFAPGKVTLRNEALRTLDGIVSTVNGTYAGKDIIVFGHTDDRPILKSGWQDNWQLSSERALAVVRYMRERGVGPDRLIGSGCGEHRPIVENNSEANRTRNRRVEIFALEQRASTGRR